ncbi:MAG: hypothetical protein ABR568_05610 [Pyrinomonadaceae bacterium]
MRRSFEDKDFKTFVLSDQLSAQAQALAETLERWRRADVRRAATLALAYLHEVRTSTPRFTRSSSHGRTASSSI